MKRIPILLIFGLMLFVLPSCRQGNAVDASGVKESSGDRLSPIADTSGPSRSAAEADASTILSRKEVPILCYHQIREWRASDTRGMRDNIIPPAAFASHMKALRDSGYASILPEQLLGYLTRGDSLPPKPVMVTFDDGSAGQYGLGMSELERHGFRGVFYIMTVSIGKPGYMSESELRALSDRGHVVASHSWDHKNVLHHDSADWRVQLAGSRERLEGITGRPVHHFAYPYGLWDLRTVAGLKKAGYISAVILSTRRDSLNPLFTIRRLNVPGDWSARSVIRAMDRTFR